MQEYEIAGEFYWRLRLKTAILTHLKNFILAAIIGFVSLIILIFKGAVTIETLPTFLQVLSNCWGLLLILVFLGYGLLAIPKKLWRLGNNKNYLDYLYLRVLVSKEEIEKSHKNLEKVVKNLCAVNRKTPKNSMIGESLKSMIDLCPESLVSANKSSFHEIIPEVVTEKMLVGLHKKLKNALTLCKIAKFEWSKVILHAVEMEDIVGSEYSQTKKIEFTLAKDDRKYLISLRQIVEWYWYNKLKPLFCRLAAILLAIYSLLIIIGESTLFIDIPIGVFPLMFEDNRGFIYSQLMCLIPLSYILVCTYYGLFQLKLPGWYGLYSKNTEPSSLIYSAFYLTRLSAPLAYNFFLFIKIDKAIFFSAMKMENIVITVGDRIFIYFPIILVLFCLLNYTNAYGKVLNLLGFSQFSELDESYHLVIEGKYLVAKEKSHIQKNFSLETFSSEIPNWNLAQGQREKPKKSDRLLI